MVGMQLMCLPVDSTASLGTSRVPKCIAHGPAASRVRGEAEAAKNLMLSTPKTPAKAAAQIYRPNMYRTSQKAKDLQKKVDALNKSLLDSAVEHIYLTLPKCYTDVDDFLKSSDLMQPTFGEQLKIRLETLLLCDAPAGKALENAGKTPAMSLAITRQMLQAFDGKNPSNIQKICTPVPEILDAQRQIEKFAKRAQTSYGMIEIYIASFVPKKTSSGHDTGNASEINEILQEIQAASASVDKIFEGIVQYHIDRSTMVKNVRKYGNWDFYQSMIIHDFSQVDTLHNNFKDLCTNLLTVYDMLVKSKDTLRKPGRTATANIMH